MENLTPKNIIQFIKDGLEKGTFKSQTEIVAITGSGKSYVSELLAGKKEPGWDFVKRFENGLVNNSSTKENMTEPKISEPKPTLLTEIAWRDKLIQRQDELIASLQAQVTLMTEKMTNAWTTSERKAKTA